MSNLNWPEGATHYLQAGEEQTRFRDLSGERWKYFNSYTGKWVQHCFSSEDLLRRHDLIARPQPKPWSGPEDGLPPVNTSCHMQDDMGQWVDVLIIANHDGYAHGWQSARQDCFYSNDPAEFRAVSTPEQLRETAIREIMDVADVDCRVTAARLVDAGFKRGVV